MPHRRRLTGPEGYWIDQRSTFKNEEGGKENILRALLFAPTTAFLTLPITTARDGGTFLLSLPLCGMLIHWRVVVPAGILTRRSLLERLRLRRGRTRRDDNLFGDRQWPPVLLELIKLISLLARVSGVRSSLWFWSSLGVLGERGLPSGELFDNILDRFSPGIIPGLIGSGRWADFRNWLFLDLGLSGRSTRGTSQGIERSRELEQRFASGGFRALLLPLGASRLRRRFRNLLGRLIYLREIILVYLRSLRLLLRLRRWDERRRSGNGRRRRLKRCGRFREVGNRGSAEVREVRNGLKTIGDGSQNGQTRRCGRNIPRH